MLPRWLTSSTDFGWGVARKKSRERLRQIVCRLGISAASSEPHPAGGVVMSYIFCILLVAAPTLIYSQPWLADLGNGKYKNPIIADYSDPDVIRVGDDFYLTASSFNCFSALPILHSLDLINWTIVNHAIDRFPSSDFATPQHGNGVWAPSIRYHDGAYWLYYGDPDRGIYLVKTTDPLGKLVFPAGKQRCAAAFFSTLARG